MTAAITDSALPSCPATGRLRVRFGEMHRQWLQELPVSLATSL